MTRVAVLDDYQQVAEGLADWKSLGGDVSVEFFHDHVPDEDAVAARLKEFDVVTIMRERTKFPRSLIRKLPNLRLLVTTGNRNASIDLAACAEANVLVCNTGSPFGDTTELTWALILAVARNLPQEYVALKAGHWQTTLGTQLSGKTIGVVGLGRIGADVARIGRAFGMTSIAWSPNLTDERAEKEGATRVDKAELFERADVVGVHMVLSDRSRGLVGRDEFARMKKTAFLVNTSRGPIVDENALVAALREGRIAGAGIDVYEHEPLAADHPYRELTNIVLTPHIGYVTRDTYSMFYPEVVEDIRAWRAGAPVRIMTAKPA